MWCNERGEEKYMMRCKELEEYIQGYCFERMNIKWEYIDNNYSMLFPSFIENLDILIKSWCTEQKDKEQDKIKYLIFQRLRTSGYTGTYEISMGLSNSMLYLGEHMSCIYWKPDLIYENIDRDMENIRKKLGQKYIRIEEYELLYIKQKLLLDDWKLLFRVLGRLSDKAAEKIQERYEIFEDEIELLAGDYMDRLDIVGSISANRE